MIETLVGTFLGGLFRLAPEIMKAWNAKDERRHELAMFDKQLEADRVRGEMKLEQTRVEGDITLGVEELKALVEGVKIQGQLTGIKFVDVINSLMRPIITFWWVIFLQSAVMIATYVAALHSGLDAGAALLANWGPAEKSIVASIVSFWFLDRAIRMAGK